MWDGCGDRTVLMVDDLSGALIWCEVGIAMNVQKQVGNFQEGWTLGRLHSES